MDKSVKRSLKSRKSSKKSKPASPYKRTSRKVTIKGKLCTVYLRVKDGKECVRRRNKAGKTVYRKLTSLAKKGGCGCAAAPVAGMKGGQSPFAEALGKLGLKFGGDNNAAPQAVEPVGAEAGLPTEMNLEGGAQRLEKNKKDALYKKARKYGVKGRSKMTKKQLVVAVRAAQRALGERLRRRGKGKSRVV